MKSFDLSAQGMVHALEQGWLAPYIKGMALGLMVVALSVVYIFIQFRGLKHSDAMDQAQIARSIAAGEGFSTKYIRPLAMWQLQHSGKELPAGAFPDFSQQPLQPLLNAIPLSLAKGSWKMDPLDIIYAGDRVVVIVSTIFFLLSALIWFFVARQLFDDKLASFALAAILLTDLFWQFAISGLPQMLLLFLFSLAMWLTVLALGDNVATNRKGFIYLVPAGAIMGLMVLAHGLAVWIALGWILFMGYVYRHKLLPVVLAVVAFAMIVSPWLVRNYQVCGNPLGLSAYGALWPGGETDRTMMREVAPNFRSAARGMRAKIKDGVVAQAGNLFDFIGLNVLAAAFFVSLLHRFKSPVAGVFRWGVFVMWVFASFGMALFGIRGDPVSANQLHVIFIPLMVFFGTAFLLVIWNRLAIGNYLIDKAFAGFLLFLVAIPMLATVFLSTPLRIQWPPYVPPFISVLANWYGEEEILCSDMPWAVAWYANRKTLLLPESPRTLTRINDYRVLGGPITGLYLTPITGNQPLVSQIYKGTYKEWSRLLTRPPEMQGFFLKVFTPLPVDGECIIFADRERWLKR